jgi:hypothetical protein
MKLTVMVILCVAMALNLSVAVFHKDSTERSIHFLSLIYHAVLGTLVFLI